MFLIVSGIFVIKVEVAHEEAWFGGGSEVGHCAKNVVPFVWVKIEDEA